MSVGKCLSVKVSVNGQNPICAIPRGDGFEGGFDVDGFFNGSAPGPNGIVSITSDRQTATFTLDGAEYEDGLALRSITGITPKGRRAVEFSINIPDPFIDGVAIALATDGANYYGKEPVDGSANNNYIAVAIGGSSPPAVDTPSELVEGFAAGAQITQTNTILLGDLAGGFIYKGAICITRASSGVHRTLVFDIEDYRNITEGAFVLLNDLFALEDPWAGAIDNIYWYQPDNELIVTADNQIYVLDLDDVLAGYTASQPFATAPTSAVRDPFSGNWVVADDLNQDITVYDSAFTELHRYEELSGGGVNFGFYKSPTGGNDWIIVNATGASGGNVFYNRTDFLSGTLTDESSSADAVALNANINFGSLCVIDSARRVAYEYVTNTLRVIALEDTGITELSEGETNRVFNLSFDATDDRVYVRDNLGAFISAAVDFAELDTVYPYVFLTETANGDEFSVTVRQQVEHMQLQQWAGSVDYLPFITPIADINQLSARWYHNLYVDDTGAVFGWGDNTAGQLDIPALGVIVQVAAGGSSNPAEGFSLALDEDGNITGWGVDDEGVLSNIPTGDTYVFIAAGDSTAMAITSEGAIVGWGSNQDNMVSNIPVLTDAIAVSIGFGHGIALRANGQVVCWGRNSSRQTEVPSFLDHCIAVSAYWEASAALTKNGKLITWGASHNKGQGQSDKRFTRIAAGRQNFIGLEPNGGIEVLGVNDDSQLVIPDNIGTVIDVACGFLGWHTTLSEAPCLVGFGVDTNGQATPPPSLACPI